MSSIVVQTTLFHTSYLFLMREVESQRYDAEVRELLHCITIHQ